jgi:hypothetical protein
MTTPFELRFNYLNFAREHLISEYNAALERIMISIEETDVRKPLIEKLRYPTKEDIFDLADQIKNFSDQK